MDFWLQKIGQKLQFSRFLAIFANSFHGQTLKLGLQTDCENF